jgi:hypothetical protein
MHWNSRRGTQVSRGKLAEELCVIRSDVSALASLFNSFKDSTLVGVYPDKCSWFPSVPPHSYKNNSPPYEGARELSNHITSIYHSQFRYFRCSPRAIEKEQTDTQTFWNKGSLCNTEWSGSESKHNENRKFTHIAFWIADERDRLRAFRAAPALNGSACSQSFVWTKLH